MVAGCKLGFVFVQREHNLGKRTLNTSHVQHISLVRQQLDRSLIDQHHTHCFYQTIRRIIFVVCTRVWQKMCLWPYCVLMRALRKCAGYDKLLFRDASKTSEMNSASLLQNMLRKHTSVHNNTPTAEWITNADSRMVCFQVTNMASVRCLQVTNTVTVRCLQVTNTDTVRCLQVTNTANVRCLQVTNTDA